MIVYPDKETGEDVFRERYKPMVDQTPSLAKLKTGYVADEKGLLDIPKSEMSESVKISKGGFNDQIIFPNCYLTKQDVREMGDYMGGDHGFRSALRSDRIRPGTFA